MVMIEVETESEAQVQEAIHAGSNIIMFDNQSPQSIHKLSKLVPSYITTEASGGITLDNLKNYNTCVIDYISLGFRSEERRVGKECRSRWGMYDDRLKVNKVSSGGRH